MKKKLTFIVIFLINLSSISYSFDYYPVGIYANGGINLNFANSNGIEIPPFCPTCIGLKNGKGLGYNFGLGFNVNPSHTLFNLKYSYGAYLSYSNLYSNINKTEFLGNLILGNEMIKGDVNYNLDVFFKSLNFTPYIYLYPFEKLNIALKLGVDFSYLIGSNNELTEKTVKENTFFTNGATEKKYEANEVLNAKSFFVSLPIGLKYDLLKFKNLTISPELQYNLALSNIQESSKLKINRFSAGISLVYQFEKSVKKPIAPIAPELPKPALEEGKSADIVSTVDWLVNNSKITSNDTLNIVLNKQDYYDEVPILKYLFFDYNSTELKNSFNDSTEVDIIDNPEAIQQKYFSDLPDIIRNNNVRIIDILSTSDEDNDIGKKRLSFLQDFLASKNIDIDKIKFNLKRINVNKLKYPELAEENRVIVLHSEKIKNENISFINQSSVDFPIIENVINLGIFSDYYVTGINGNVSINENEIYKIESARSDFSVNSSDLFEINNEMKHKIYLNYTLENSANNIKNFKDSINLLFTINMFPDEINYKYSMNDDSSSYYQYILSLFDFDKSKFNLINKKAQNLLYDAIKQNKKVEIFGCSDNLGTIDYNSTLINKRVKNTLKALKIKANQVTIIENNKPLFDNNNPIGRMYNRSVIIRVYN